MTQKDKFKQQAVSNPQPPKPQVPRLPDVFVSRYEPEIQKALRAYDAQWEQYFKLVTVRESTTDTAKTS